jgi:DNA-binding MarR family transcriptional regulator
MDWKKVAWLNRGKRRKDILRVFSQAKRPITINELKNISQIAISQASFNVHELYDLGLISCKNPNDKIGKLFEITEKGNEILKFIIGS